MIFVDDDGCPTQNKKLVKIWIISEFQKEQELFQKNPLNPPSYY